MIEPSTEKKSGIGLAGRNTLTSRQITTMTVASATEACQSRSKRPARRRNLRYGARARDVSAGFVKGLGLQGERVTENIYEGQVNDLVKCMNAIYKGIRSTSACFLDGKPNIAFIAETRAKKLLIEDSRATGALLIDNSGKEFEMHAKREVTLSTGVFEVGRIPLSLVSFS